MNTQLWNPFQEFENLLDRYNKSSGGAMRSSANSDLSFADWAPSVDIGKRSISWASNRLRFARPNTWPRSTD